MATVVITGAAGMLGSALVDQFADSHDVIATDLAVGVERQGVRWLLCDLDDDVALRHLVTSERPDLVVHAAALVNVDLCERHPSTAQRVHVGATDTLSQLLSRWGGALIYISTDSVFDGGKAGAYVESDRPAPTNTYARTKLEGEAACLNLASGTVLRTNIFGWTRSGRLSFAEWVLMGLADESDLGMFRDVSFTPINVTHLAAIVDEVFQQRLFGLYHAAGSMCLTKYEFALLVADVFGLSSKSVRAVDIDDAGLVADRPKNMALSSARLSSLLQRPLPSADDGIRLMKRQYEEGRVARLKQHPVPPTYRFWESQ